MQYSIVIRGVRVNTTADILAAIEQLEKEKAEAVRQCADARQQADRWRQAYLSERKRRENFETKMRRAGERFMRDLRLNTHNIEEAAS